MYCCFRFYVDFSEKEVAHMQYRPVAFHFLLGIEGNVFG